MKTWNLIDLFDYCFARKNDNITVTNNDNTTSTVGAFRYLTFLWCENGINFNTIDPDKYILSSNAFMQLIRTKFFDFEFVTSYTFNPDTGKREYIETMDDASDELINAINIWKHDKLPAFRKLFDALRADYNPISNYDKVSTITTEYQGKEKTEFTPTGTESDTLSMSGTESDTLTKSGTENRTFSKGEEDRQHFRTPYDSGTALLTEEDKLTGTDGVAYEDSDTLGFTNRQDTNTKSFQNRQDTNTHSFTNRKDTSERSFTNRQDVVTEHTSGNIGVTTSQQMLLSQFGITDADSMEYYCVSDFVRSCCIHK